jgi:photosystem II stability/assembly factor-like uncharacterized protein
VRNRISLLAAALILGLIPLASASAAGHGHAFAWQLTPTGSNARLRGLAAVSSKVAWTSGSLGTVLRTVDRGATWEQVSQPGTSTLQFRDIEASDAAHAVILSIGTGTDSRIYETSDAGATWALAFVNDDPNAFYDCMAFSDKKHGFAVSDPVDGRFRVIVTSDGGRSWHLATGAMPPALPGEFGFAASGECAVTAGGRDAWFASGGAAQARVFHSRDRGRSWQVSATPIHSGPTAGIFALAFHGPRHGLAVGGDFVTPTVAPDALALTADRGATWQLVADAPNEYRSGATWMTGRIGIVVGPTGSDLTLDRGRSWHRFDTGSFDTVDCAHAGACWASGEQGRVAYLVKQR